MSKNGTSPAPLGINTGSGVGVKDVVGQETKKILEMKRKAEQAVKDALTGFVHDSGMRIGGVTFEHKDKILVKVRILLEGEET